MENHGKKIDYPYVLDHKPGFFLSWLLYKLFKKVKLEENTKEALKQMQREGTVVYANKYRGLLDYLLYHYTLRKRRLPYPKIAFDLNISWVLPLGRLLRVLFSQASSFIRYGKIPSPYKTGFYKNAIRQRIPALISLVDPEGFLRSFILSEKDHLHFLLETQREMDRPIFIVPQLILFKQTPEKEHSNLIDILFGYKDNPGVIRKITLFLRYYSSAFIDFGTPLNLAAYLEDQPPERSLEDMATEIRQTLIERIDSQKRIILGPIMKTRQQFKEIVLKDKNVIRQIEKRAAGNHKKLKEQRKKAGEYFDEIAADYNSTYIQVFLFGLKWLWKRIFDEIDIDQPGIAKVREWARRGPLIYIPSHKSHVDYLVLNYMLYHYHMHPPRVAAGQNLAFWPMGHIFRKCGAFFMRRSFKGAKLYSEVFSRYIKALLQERHPIEFYIEGGRSRNGKLVLPKIGFLSILLKAYEEGFCQDLIFVPASIIYDRILEENAYLKEIGGGRKEKETLKQMINARHFLKRRYGKIYIRFNEPFSLNEYLSKLMASPKDVNKDLAFHLVNSINAVSLVTPLALVGTAILTNHRKGFNISELDESVNILMDFLKAHGIPFASTLNSPSRATRDTLSLLINWKVVDSMEDAPDEEEKFYFVDEDKKMELEYYKNSVIHFFIHHSFVEISFLSGSEEEKSIESLVADYCFLKELFCNEFVFDECDDIHEKISLITEYFLDAGFLSSSEATGGYKITKSGFDKLPIWASLTKTFIESYWITAKAMGREENGKGTRENLLKNIDYLGKRYHKLGVVEHIEALSRINFQNALSFINRKVLNSHDSQGEQNTGKFEKLSHLSRKLYKYSHYGQ